MIKSGVTALTEALPAETYELGLSNGEYVQSII